MIETVGSTTTSPTLTPLRISVVEVPTRPVVTVVTVFSPFRSIVTVETRPVVVIAALGSTSTFVLLATTTLTSAVMPCARSPAG